MDGKEIYILSTGRSGSTFLSKLFKEKCIDKNIGHQKEGSRIINIISNIPETPTFLLSGLLKLFKRGYPPTSTADPLLSMAILKLIEAGKIDEKVVHLVRDPRTFVESFMNWKAQSIRKKFLHHCVPFWNPVPYLSDSKVDFTQWIRMSKFEKFCWVWNYKNKLFYNLRYNSDNYLLIKLESITSKNRKIRSKAFLRLENFLKVSIEDDLNFKKKVNPSRESSFSPYADWSKKEQDILKKHCGKLAKKLGYQIS